MANVSESPVYDAGVYQLETTDPVQGGSSGISNNQAKNLANRTAYLKQHVDLLEAGTTVPPGIATLNSPTFTGDPKAPTAPVGDNDTTIANTAFVTRAQGNFSGQSTISASATLTVANVGKSLLLGGTASGQTLTLPAAASVPNGSVIALQCSDPNPWSVVRSSTDGIYFGGSFVVAFNLSQNDTVFLSSDSGYGWQVVAGSVQLPYSTILQGANFTTPPQFDSTTKLATTAFVQRALGNRSNATIASASGTLTAANCGAPVFAQAASSITLTLPSLAALPIGAIIEIESQSLNPVVVQRAGSDVITASNANPSLTSITLGDGDSISIMKLTAGSWLIVGGSVVNIYSSSFAASLAGSGYQKLPSGLIIQWGTVASIPGNGNATVTYPLAFLSACLSVVACAGASNIGLPAISGVNATISNKTGFIAYNTSASVATQAGLYIALGY